ncbi:MAG: class F sortase [Candidatus Paceibacterota bacterium]
MNRIYNSQSLGVTTALIVVLVLLSILGLSMLAVRDSVPLPANDTIPENREEMLGGFTPHKIIIPRIDIAASVVPVGVDKEGNMAVPEELLEVGWYEPGFKPGEMGSAVFAGHVNSRFGLPTIFKDLEMLEVGDTFSILAENEEEFTFEIVAINTYDFRNAPLEEIYGPQDVPTINLITCDDNLWLGSEGTYKDRLVVTAVLVSPENDE